MKIRKIALTIALLSNGTLFAGVMGDACNKSNLNIPCEVNSFDIGAQALYLQANDSDRNFISSHITANNFSQYLDLTPQYAWGFKVEGAYHFKTGNDINLNWYSVQNSSKATYIGETFYNNQSPLTNSFNKHNSNWNAVNLEIGQHIDFNDTKSLRLHGGVQYSRVVVQESRSGTGLNNGTPYTSLFNADSTYNGFGPRVGADMNYGVGYGFGVYANAATTLLVGPQGFKSSYSDTTNTLNGARGGSTTGVVPELEGKLGLNYSYMLAQGHLTLDLGWMWINYFQIIAHDNYDYATQSRANVAYSNFSEQGPYIGLKWLGNAL